jgi:hypothetical protein
MRDSDPKIGKIRKPKSVMAFPDVTARERPRWPWLAMAFCRFRNNARGMLL